MSNIFDEQASKNIKSNGNVFADFLVNKGLYDKIEIAGDNNSELADLVGGYVNISVYCPECKEIRVFHSDSIIYYRYVSNRGFLQEKLETAIRSKYFINPDGSPFNDCPEEEYRIMVIKFYCAMDEDHRLDYIVLIQGNQMIKIGQYPSVADLSFPELKDYRKVMQKEDEKELRRAIGLFASGIGVGSFVYLRRIFERIIVNASKKAIQEGKITEEELVKCRVDEKIKKLSDYLPKSLIDNTVFYGIISKGIHELTEEECLEYFPVMKGFIMLILRQWEQMRRDEEEEKAIQASLSKIAGKITNT